MKLRILGTGNAFQGDSTAFLIQDIYPFMEEKLDILIDCGPTVFRKLLDSAYDFSRLAWIAITHTHEDHIGSLSTLIHWMRLRGLSLPQLCAPYEVAKEVQKYLEVTGTPRLTVDQRLPFFYTEHTVPSCGYVVPGVGIFTGDTLPDKNVVNAAEKYPEIPIYHDLCFEDGPDNPHTTLEDLDLYPKWMRSRIVGVHYGKYSGIDAVICASYGIKLAKEGCYEIDLM